MAIDVLRFNEQKNQINCYKCCTTSFLGCQRVYNDALSLNSACVTSNPWWVGARGKCASFNPQVALSLCSTNLFPSLSSATGFSVCSTSNDFNAGVCCQFTVPPGVSQIRFQAWGAGAASAGSCCCGGSVSGGTGAYASVIIPAVAGCQYTICSGCAYWPGGLCVATSDSMSNLSGCASFVSGFGLCNFCAEGGEGSLFNWSNRHRFCTSNVPVSCTMFSVSDGYGGLAGSCNLCICANGAWCSTAITTNWQRWPYNSSPNTGSPTPHGYCFVSSCKTYYGCATSTIESSNNSFRVYGLPGMLSSYSIEGYTGSYCGETAQAPVYPFSSCALSVQWSSQLCIGGCSCAGTAVGCLICAVGTATPGMGGLGTRVTSGCYMGGSPGKMGMVCVQYT